MAAIGHFAKRVESSCIVSLMLSMLSLVNAHAAMPSYNLALPGWGLFASYSRSCRAVFGLISFEVFSIVLDIIFLSLWSQGQYIEPTINEILISLANHQAIFRFNSTYVAPSIAS